MKNTKRDTYVDPISWRGLPRHRRSSKPRLGILLALASLGSSFVTPAETAHAAPTIQVKPIFECYTEDVDGTYSAYFSYENLSTDAGKPVSVTIAKGTNNKLTPAADSNMLPEAFGLPRFVAGRPGRTAFGTAEPKAFVVHGWDGKNLVWKLGASTATASLSSKCVGAWAPLCHGLRPTVVGTKGNDTIFGTAGNDVIATGNGDDSVDGGTGNDTICADNGNDTVTGGDGNDTVETGNGDDIVFGGNGNDTIDTGNGNDKAVSEDGSDTIATGNGDDIVLGGNGNDTIDTGNGNDKAIGEDGSDTIGTGNGDDTAEGGPGTDQADTGAGIDSCSSVELPALCEHNVEAEAANSFNSYLAARPVAGPGIVSPAGFDGVTAIIDSNGGIRPEDVKIHADYESTDTVGPLAASAVYQFEVPPAAAAFNTATITIPYDVDRLGPADETMAGTIWPDGLHKLPISPQQLQIHWYNPELGLWVPAADNQVVDEVAQTVTAEVTHFSEYVVLATGADGTIGSLLYPPGPRATCSADLGAAVVASPADVVLAIEQSDSISQSDPNGRRFDLALALVATVAQREPTTRFAVVGFDSSFELLQPFTAATSSVAIKSAIAAARRRGTAATSLLQGVLGSQSLFTPSNNRPRRIILFTNGTDNVFNSPLSASGPIDGVTTPVLTAQVTDNGNESWLDAQASQSRLAALATATGGTYYPANSTSLGELATSLVPAGDSDGDGLTDCEETVGFYTNIGIYKLANPGGILSPDGLLSAVTTTDPHNPDTDGDGLNDGVEAGRRIDLRTIDPSQCRPNRGATDCTAYASLIAAGVSVYYLAISDPTLTDSDSDGLTDKQEVDGVVAGVAVDKTKPLDADTDNDGLNDGLEALNGTHGAQLTPNELSSLKLLDGSGRYLPPFTLFQPVFYENYHTEDGLDFLMRPVVEHGYGYGVVNFWNDSDVFQYDSNSSCNDVNGADICSVIDKMVRDSAPSVGQCLWDAILDVCADEATREARLVNKIVDAQGVFDAQGELRPEWIRHEAQFSCVTRFGLLAPQCDQIPTPSASSSLLERLASVVTALLDLPFGYRNPDCVDKTKTGGVYEMIKVLKDGTEKVVYVGKARNFLIREAQHLRSLRFKLPPGADFVYKMRPKYFTLDDVYQTALEQQLFNDNWGNVTYQEAQNLGSLNGERPVTREKWDYTPKNGGRSMREIAEDFKNGKC